MNKNEMPSFNNLARLARESRNQVGLGRPTRKITFVTKGLVSNLNSYGADIMAMCSGLTTYMAREVHGPQLNLRSCTTLDVMKVVDLNYCHVRINSQNRVAIIQQTSKDLSWKTIWNYNTGIIATKVTQQNTCYISVMNRTEMPSFDNLARLARESR
ncbi:gastrokine-1-like, partial [Empidonax traillii]|uniref:gastrokine-1-like n=1 Tax=Empidonax traillii TaxID=164674 RepID=UPI000FFD4AC5